MDTSPPSGCPNSRRTNSRRAAWDDEREMIAPRDTPVEWVRSPGLVSYEAACALMAQRVDAIAAGRAAELVWLLEHPPLYTAGTSARDADLIEPGRFPVHRSGRGGQFTYHGPGQRVGYVMLDVRARWGGG